MKIVELDAIRTLSDADQVVIACGGGGIPVLEQDHRLKGASAVIEKDLTAGKLAEELNADALIILTSVEKVFINRGTDKEEQLGEISVSQAKQYMERDILASTICCRSSVRPSPSSKRAKAAWLTLPARRRFVTH